MFLCLLALRARVLMYDNNGTARSMDTRNGPTNYPVLRHWCHVLHGQGYVSNRHRR